MLFWRRSFDVSQLPGFYRVGPVFPQHGSLTVILGEHIGFLSLLVAGVFTLGVLTAAGLVTRGAVTGYVLAPSLGEVEVSVLVVALFPHGIIIAFAFVLTAAISFRIVVCALGRVAGLRAEFLSPAEWRQVGLLLFCAWLLLVVGVVLEVYLSLALAEWLF